MPLWLKKQLQDAYKQKDIKRIRLLNQCWFYYKKIEYNTSTKINTME